jgi:hypothetical protein
METSGVGLVGAQAAVQVEKISQDQEKAMGSAAVELIQASAVPPPPPSPDGRGTHINEYA